MRILHLYRPVLPDTRAQSIQVFRSCHALATLGHEVALFANRGPIPPSELYRAMGLSPHPHFKVSIAPVAHRGLAGLWFRRKISTWWHGPPGVVLARDIKRMLAAIDSHGKKGHKVVLETHGLQSLLLPDITEHKAQERQCLTVIDAMIANCGGTAQAWTDAYSPMLPITVCHNASHLPPPLAQNRLPSEQALVLGSMRPNKGVNAVLAAGRRLAPTRQMLWIGGTESERQAHPQSATLKLLAPVVHGRINDIIAAARVLVVPLGNNIFSHQLTSPLKLWDYLATTKPIVIADTPATREIAALTRTPFHFYEAENIDSITSAIDAAWNAPPRNAFQRTWAQRARELEAVFTDIGVAP